MSAYMDYSSHMQGVADLADDLAQWTYDRAVVKLNDAINTQTENLFQESLSSYLSEADDKIAIDTALIKQNDNEINTLSAKIRELQQNTSTASTPEEKKEFTEHKNSLEKQLEEAITRGNDLKEEIKNYTEGKEKATGNKVVYTFNSAVELQKTVNDLNASGQYVSAITDTINDKYMMVVTEHERRDVEEYMKENEIESAHEYQNLSVEDTDKGHIEHVLNDAGIDMVYNPAMQGVYQTEAGDTQRNIRMGMVAVDAFYQMMEDDGLSDKQLLEDSKVRFDNDAMRLQEIDKNFLNTWNTKHPDMPFDEHNVEHLTERNNFRMEAWGSEDLDIVSMAGSDAFFQDMEHYTIAMPNGLNLTDNMVRDMRITDENGKPFKIKAIGADGKVLKDKMGNEIIRSPRNMTELAEAIRESQKEVIGTGGIMGQAGPNQPGVIPPGTNLTIHYHGHKIQGKDVKVINNRNRAAFEMFDNLKNQYGIDILNSPDRQGDFLRLQAEIIKRHTGIIQIDRKGHFDEKMMLEALQLGPKNITKDELRFLLMSNRRSTKSGVFGKFSPLVNMMRNKAMQSGNAWAIPFMHAYDRHRQIMKTIGAMDKALEAEAKIKIRALRIGNKGRQNVMQTMTAGELAKDIEKKKTKEAIKSFRDKFRERMNQVSPVQKWRRFQFYAKDKFRQTSLGRWLGDRKSLYSKKKKEFLQSRFGKFLSKFLPAPLKPFKAVLKLNHQFLQWRAKVLLPMIGKILGAAMVPVLLPILACVIVVILCSIGSFFSMPQIGDSVGHKLYENLVAREEEWVQICSNIDDRVFSKRNRTRFGSKYLSFDSYVTTVGAGNNILSVGGQVYLNPYSFTPATYQLTPATGFDDNTIVSIENANQVKGTGHTSNIKDILAMTDVMFEFDSPQAGDEKLGLSTGEYTYKFSTFLSEVGNFIKKAGALFFEYEYQEPEQLASYQQLMGYTETLFDASHQETVDLIYNKYSHSGSTGGDKCPQFDNHGCSEASFFFHDFDPTEGVDIEPALYDTNGQPRECHPDPWFGGGFGDGMCISAALAYEGNLMDDDPNTPMQQRLRKFYETTNNESIRKCWQDGVPADEVTMEPCNGSDQPKILYRWDRANMRFEVHIYDYPEEQFVMVKDQDYQTPNTSKPITIAMPKNSVEWGTWMASAWNTLSSLNGVAYNKFTWNGHTNKTVYKYGTQSVDSTKWSNPTIRNALLRRYFDLKIALLQKQKPGVSITGDYQHKTYTETTYTMVAGQEHRVSNGYMRRHTIHYRTWCCQGGHRGRFCAGHVSTNIVGKVYTMTKDQIRSLGVDEEFKKDTSEVEPWDAKVGKVDYSTVDTAYASGLNIDVENSQWKDAIKSAQINTERVMDNETIAEDIFDIDHSILYRKRAFPVRGNFKKYQGWNKDYMTLAILKYSMDWKELYDIEFQNYVGGGNAGFYDGSIFFSGMPGERPLPGGLGKNHAHMGWHKITSPTSYQYKLKTDVQKKQGGLFNSDGMGIVKCSDGDRYAVAMKPYFGSVGDYVDITFSNDITIQCVIADIKSNENAQNSHYAYTKKWWDVDNVPAPEWNMYAHGWDIPRSCVVEFVVDTSYAGYSGSKSVDGVHPEWAGTTVKQVINRGSWFNGDPMSEEDMAQYAGVVGAGVEAAIAEGIRIANSASYQYSQGSRHQHGPSAGYFDCSSLSCYLAYYAGASEFICDASHNVTTDTLYNGYLSKYSIGNNVPVSAMQPGDIAVYRIPGTNNGHAAFYIGNGQFINAGSHYPSHSQDDITIKDFAGTWIPKQNYKVLRPMYPQ